LNTSVYVDNNLIADLDPGTFVSVKAAAGPHTVYSDSEDDAFTVTVKPGQNVFFRVDIVTGVWKGHGKLNLVLPEQGAGEFASGKLKQAKDIREPSVVVPGPLR
jgi:hypothetical protein